MNDCTAGTAVAKKRDSANRELAFPCGLCATAEISSIILRLLDLTFQWRPGRRPLALFLAWPAVDVSPGDTRLLNRPKPRPYRLIRMRNTLWNIRGRRHIGVR